MAIGFVWLLLIQISYALGTDARAVIKVQQRDFAWEERCYTRDEAYQRVLATAGTAHDIAPNVIWPALLLLAGGCGAARNGRRTPVTPPRDDSSAEPSSKNA